MKSTEIIDIYNGLTEHKKVLLLFCAITGHPQSRKDLLECLRFADVLHPSGNVYTQQRLKPMLAERLQISSGYLSQIINEKGQKNFFEFINRYRVEAVKKKLLDKEFKQFSIMGIASECGFSSKSAFNSVFKQFTGLTPTAFRKKHL